jgi:hypothetical protein
MGEPYAHHGRRVVLEKQLRSLEKETINMNKTPIRPQVPPLLEGPHTPPDDGWFNICLAWFAGYVVCYIVMTL